MELNTSYNGSKLLENYTQAAINVSNNTMQGIIAVRQRNLAAPSSEMPRLITETYVTPGLSTTIASSGEKTNRVFHKLFETSKEIVANQPKCQGLKNILSCVSATISQPTDFEGIHSMGDRVLAHFTWEETLRFITKVENDQEICAALDSPNPWKLI